MTDMHYMLSIDPGGTTGYCIGSFDGTTLSMEIAQERLSGSELFDLIKGQIPADEEGKFYLIYEKFHYRNKARPGLDLTAPKLIGVIDLACEQFGLNYFPQMPSEAMGFWTNDRLRQYQIYVPGLEHGRDAMRHMLQWWQFKFGFGIHRITPFTQYKVEAKK